MPLVASNGPVETLCLLFDSNSFYKQMLVKNNYEQISITCIYLWPCQSLLSSQHALVALKSGDNFSPPNHGGQISLLKNQDSWFKFQI